MEADAYQVHLKLLAFIHKSQGFSKAGPELRSYSKIILPPLLGKRFK